MRWDGARRGVGGSARASELCGATVVLGRGVGITKALSLEGVFSTQERRRERLILY